MKTIKIAHLYYDLMNLYGENGNMRILTKRLEKQDVKVEVHFLSIDDKIDFKKYDLYYIGTGSELNQELVRIDILKYKNDINEAINNNKFFLITGNALELFGSSLNKLDGNNLECINSFDFYTKETNFRIVGEQFYTTNFIEQKIIGFQNRSGTIITKLNGMFKVIDGTGFKPKANTEGINKNNFYGTYLIGPILIRNPYFTEYLIKQLLEQNNIKYKENLDGIEFLAYQEFMKSYVALH